MKSNKNTKEAITKMITSKDVAIGAGKFLLLLLALGGVVLAGAVAPGLVILLKNANYPRKYSKREMENAFYNLKRRNLIEVIQEDSDITKVKLTNKGKSRIKEYSLELLSIPRPKKWDKKWRILIFDIPTKPKIYHQAREALRHKIKELGFYQMQKSVWVYPYECEDEILFIAEIFQVQKHIEILTVEKLLHENKLRKAFQL